MKNLKVKYENSGISKERILEYQSQVNECHKMLHEKTGKGNDFLGWVDYPKNYDQVEFNKVKEAAKKIQDTCDVFIVIGIGGSYLGAKAGFEALTHTYYNELSKGERKFPKVYFAGNNISPRFLNDLMQVIKENDVCLNMISKSGTTTEPAITFRILRSLLEDKYGKDGAKDRIFATTDKEKGALKQLATNEGYETFVINDDIGGRYSVFTSVGLLPLAVAGIDVDQLMAGAKEGFEEFSSMDIMKNEAYLYAVLRNILYKENKKIEIMVNYEPSLHFVSEWWKQLYGESEGKEGLGIFPASVDFSADLHSMGQYIQEGERHIFETVLTINKSDVDIDMGFDENNLDNLNYLNGQTMDYVNKKAFEGTVLAHVDGGVPNIEIALEEINAFNFGKLLYFYMKACGMSGYILGVNPFNQPGVEAYKKNMFALLGKPGYEALAKELMNK